MNKIFCIKSEDEPFTLGIETHVNELNQRREFPLVNVLNLLNAAKQMFNMQEIGTVALHKSYIDANSGKFMFDDTPLNLTVMLSDLDAGTQQELPLVLVDSARMIFPKQFGNAIDTNEGIPHQFLTQRTETVNRFLDVIFSEVPKKVIMIKAPPLSGKTGLSQLMHQSLVADSQKKRSVVLLTCNMIDLENNESFVDFFERITRRRWDRFLNSPNEKVLLLDEAQCSYADYYLWNTVVKSTLSLSNYPTLRIILFAAFGSFNPFRTTRRMGTPVVLDYESIYHMIATNNRPALCLKQTEFQEMIKDSPFRCCRDAIWNLGSGHIGVTKSILNYLDKTLASIPSDGSLIEKVLYSNDLLEYIIRERGIPTVSRLNEVVKQNNISAEFAERMKRILDKVAFGNIVKASDQSGPEMSPGSVHALFLLIQHGFIFVNISENNRLQFASQMHMKAWLKSIRSSPKINVLHHSLTDVLPIAISQMRQSQISGFKKESSLDFVRERQFQMELYSALVSVLPADCYVTPEWMTADKRGYIDLVVKFKDTYWFIELLIEGIKKNEHCERFEVGGKYHSSLIPGSEYVIIDLRAKSVPRTADERVTYVIFSDDFASATIVNTEVSMNVSLNQEIVE